jgi:hypothetical protein
MFESDARGDREAPRSHTEAAMFRSSRRPATRLALVLLLAPTITGCTTTRQTPFNEHAVRLERATGVSMRSGKELRFRLPGASIVKDTMYAVGAKGEIIIPTDSIARVWDRKGSPVRTIALLAGVVVVGAAIAGAIAFGNDFQMFSASH